MMANVIDSLIFAWELSRVGRCGYCGDEVNDKLQCLRCGIEWESQEDMPLKWRPIETKEEHNEKGQ